MKLSKQKLYFFWPIPMFRIILPFISITFFGQINLLFVTVFGCINGSSYVNEKLKCKTGLWFKILSPFTVIAIIFHTIIAIITNLLYFNPIFAGFNSNILKKIDTLPDIVFLFTKMGFNIIFTSDKNNEENHWLILFFLFCFSGINAYFSLYYHHRANSILKILNRSLSLILFLSTTSIIIGKVFNYSGFNGLIFWFLLNNVLIILYIIFYKRKSINFAYVDLKGIDKPGKYLKYIFYYYVIFINKNDSRYDNVIFKRLIDILEEECLDMECPLKKYLSNEKNGLDSQYLLIKYCDKLFQHGMIKFPNDNNIKSNYITFLLFIINNKKKALLILNTIDETKISFKNDYNIHLCKKLIEKSDVEVNKDENDSFNEYKTDLQNLKELIRKTILLYFQFISLLLECKNKNITNFSKINKIGKKIIRMKKKIEDEYEILEKNKTNNTELIILYSNYSKILYNNDEKYQVIKYNDIINNEIDYYNINTILLKEKDNIYSIISAFKNDIGTILDCSYNFAKIFGYEKEEIKKKNINMLIPEIFHKKHNQIIKERFREDKNEFYQKLNNNIRCKPKCIKKDTYCISKSKFLIPIKMKIYPAKTHENDFIYIVSIINHIPLMSSILDLKEENSIKFCVLTDNNLIIKSFTPNCLEHLNLQYSCINSDNSIINYVREFYEEYLLAINTANMKNNHQDYNNDISDKKHGAKYEILLNTVQKNIIKKICNKKRKIIWMINKNNNSKNTNVETQFKRYSLKRRDSKINVIIQHFNEKEINLFMEIKKVILDKELLGYYFIFTKDNEDKDDKLKSNFSEANNVNVHKFKPDKSDVESSDFQSDIGITNPPAIKKLNSFKFMKDDKNNSSVGSNYKDNYKDKDKFKRMPTLHNYNNIFERIVNDNFTSNPLFLSFNIKDYSFNLTNNMNNNKNFNEHLKKEANNKMKIYNEYLKSIKKKSSTITTESEEDETENNSSSNTELVSSSTSSLSSKNKSLTQKSYTKVKSLSFLVPDPPGIKMNHIDNNKPNMNKCKTTKFVKKKERKSFLIGNGQNPVNKMLKSDNSKQLVKKELSNYYKVNLSIIRLYKYDFNRELFIEKKKKRISKMDKLLKNKEILSFSKDNTYPSYSLHKNNEKNSNKIKEENQNTINTSEKNPENKKNLLKQK